MKPQQILILLISILASFVAFLDGSIINVALPAIAKDLGGGLSVQQWVVDAYLLTLGSLILIAGSLSDLFGRKKILSAGLIGFGIASIMCAIAPTSIILIAARALQGVAGALIVPSSLALIMSNFSGELKGRAIGLWTGWTGISFIVGPLLGGLLIDTGSWRWIFAINLLPIGITLWLMSRMEKDSSTSSKVKVDLNGAILGVVGLGAPVFALIEQPRYGWGDPIIYLPLLIGLLAIGLFIRNENKVKQPMLPFKLFSDQNFSIGNLATLSIYAGLSVSTFLITVFIQQVGGYSAFQAGMALIPVTLMMLLLSGKFGALAGKYGPRIFMTAGPLIGGMGFLLMLRVNDQINYWTQLFPGILVFGLGLSITVAPLTTAILGSIKNEWAGIASAVNNAVARIAGLLAIALIGVVTGANLDLAGFKRGLIVISVLMFAGGVLSLVGIKNIPAKK